MVEAVLSAIPEPPNNLFAIRDKLTEIRKNHFNQKYPEIDLEREKTALLELFTAANITTELNCETIGNLIELRKKTTEYIHQGINVFIAYEPASAPPHIFHCVGLEKPQSQKTMQPIGLTGFLIGNTKEFIPDEVIEDVFLSQRRDAIFSVKILT